MGVKGLWTLVGPAARPTQLESLRQKRIAVDASIWIHQFMRTMRDKEGNALKNGHLLGFFRRICKLLFFDIKPVFVFDGGAPTLKRSTIRERRKRREGLKASLKATARKILSAQVKSRILMQEEQKLKGDAVADEDFVYYEELENSAAVEALKKKRKLDQYELPEMNELKHTNKLDPRLATEEELRNFVEEFDPSGLDIDSAEFLDLPVEVRYEIIQDMMWKSRSTSWARLDEMVRKSKTALDFSKQQIRQLKYRNEMTRRLAQVSTDTPGTVNETARIAGERGRQYVLYKNENLKDGLGWKLPGLSEAEPVYIDVDPNRSEPKLEIPDHSDHATHKEKPKDKVAEAMSSNPKLAALFENFLSDDEEEEDEEFETVDVKDKANDDEPLFMSSTQGVDLINDINAYADDDAINKVISRIYKDDIPPETSFPSEDDDDDDREFELNAEDFYELWLSRVPDAFIYLHSLNDEYKKIMKSSIEEHDMDRIRKDLASVKKQYSKTNESDELALEALQFHISFLESVTKWQAKHPVDDEQVLDDEEPLASTIQPMEEGEQLIIDSDEDEQDIAFVDTKLDDTIIVSDENSDDDQDIQWVSSQKSENTVEPETVAQHVHININQSTLHAQTNIDESTNDTVEENVNNNSITEEESPLIDTAENEVEGEVVEEVVEDKKIEEVVLSIDNKQDEENSTQESIIQDSVPATETNDQVTTEASKEDYGYNSEDELEGHVQGEDDEFARFVSDIASKHLDDIRTDLYNDMRDLNRQQRKDMGNSDDITDQMIQDIQELLKLFGVPYIVSPMEAEAQCAELELLKLVDGTITDDSDVFLFGASRVYKNMFNQQRYVECYQTQDIEREMLLSRTKLIQLAFLLGSDYTEGIAGVGPVAAMEILAEFSSNEEDEDLRLPLKRFKEWYDSEKDETPFQKKFRKKHNALDIPDDFPNPLVIDAYYHPAVDDSKQKFMWGQPQLDSLRIFLMEAFGWPEEKADQVLLPVLREMNKKAATGEQTTISSYFNTTNSVSSNTGKASQTKHSSKRVQSIVDNWRSQKKAKTDNMK